jgi:hypothetical protein
MFADEFTCMEGSYPGAIHPREFAVKGFDRSLLHHALEVVVSRGDLY